MIGDSEEQNKGTPRWRYLLLAALIFVLVSALLAGLWQLPHLSPKLASPLSTSVPQTAILTPTTAATPTPTIVHPTITDLNAQVNDEARTITFHLAAQVPPDRRVAEVLLWYDTATGHLLQRTEGPLPESITLSYQLDAVQEGLTRTLTTTRELDYWWLVRDTSGESVRAGNTAILGPALQALVATPTPAPPPISFTWAVSNTDHFQFNYMPGTAAERDLTLLGAVAEASLARIRSILDVEFDGQMAIYFVPRVFWQGGATYSDKVQLISYLDRNYTGVETWSYFTHEGTHALAQDLIQPKEDNQGGPDGVLVEGLAVWASNGHYGQEPLDDWAAVLAASDDYIPLADLRKGPFYDFQHETSYLEGSSFVKFLIEQYGLDKFKELYGQATSDATHDNALVEHLYGQDYAGLEADWLAYLAGLHPTPEEAEAWRLRVRSFDLMRRYETELDPDARVLPSNAPPQWTSDTLKIFLGHPNAPLNVVLETALIAIQDRMANGDLEGAAALLDDVEAALDAGGILNRPSLQARRAILDLLAAQDRAVLRADVDAYLDTLEPAYAARVAASVAETLQMPFTAYQREVVRLEVADDGLSAQGVVLVRDQVADGGVRAADNGRLFAVTFSKAADGWRMSGQEPTAPVLALPPSAGG
jgi:hypothetical protein